MNLRNQILPWFVRLAAFAPMLQLLANATPEVADPTAAYSPGGMHYPYGALSPELAREVQRADVGNPPSRFGKLTSKQWAYGATWTSRISGPCQIRTRRRNRNRGATTRSMSRSAATARRPT